MVKKYEPCQKYYDYEEYPTSEMREARYGKFVKLETYEHEMARMTAQINRQKEYIAALESKVTEIKGLVSFKLKSDAKIQHKKPVDILVKMTA